MEKLFLVVLSSIFVAARCYPAHTQIENSEVVSVPKQIILPSSAEVRARIQRENLKRTEVDKLLKVEKSKDTAIIKGMIVDLKKIFMWERELYFEKRIKNETTFQVFGIKSYPFYPEKMENETISKTEVINGEFAKINETTYTSGDAKNASFSKANSPLGTPNSKNPEYPQKNKPGRAVLVFHRPSGSIRLMKVETNVSKESEIFQDVINGEFVKISKTTYTSGDAKNASFSKANSPWGTPNSKNPEYPQKNKPRRAVLVFHRPSGSIRLMKVEPNVSKESEIFQVVSKKNEILKVESNENEILKNISNEND